MAGTSLLALIDDIATVLDDVAILTKVAARKTAGVLGDDLALNAQQVVGMRADRELPVVGAVAKGSLLNKAILVPQRSPSAHLRLGRCCRSSWWAARSYSTPRGNYSRPVRVPSLCRKSFALLP
jgi:hypothetical protein